MQGTIQNAEDVNEGDIVEHVEYDGRWEVVDVSETKQSMSVRNTSPYANDKTSKKTVLGLFTVVA